MSCRYGVTCWVACVNASSTAEAGAESAALARFTDARTPGSAAVVGATGNAVVLRAPRRALR